MWFKDTDRQLNDDTFPLPAPTLSCMANGHINGCCTSTGTGTGFSECSVVGANLNICSCDVECYVSGTCCGDIADINCFRKLGS